MHSPLVMCSSKTALHVKQVFTILVGSVFQIKIKSKQKHKETDEALLEYDRIYQKKPSSKDRKKDKKRKKKKDKKKRRSKKKKKKSKEKEDKANDKSSSDSDDETESEGDEDEKGSDD